MKSQVLRIDGALSTQGNQNLVEAENMEGYILWKRP